MSTYSEHANAVGRILTHKGQAQAQGALNKGAIRGNTIATLGEIAGNLPAQVLQAMEQGKKRQQEEQINAIFQKHGSNLDAAIEELITVNPVLGMDFRDRKLKSDTTAYEWKTKQWEMQKQEVELLGNLLGAATDQDGWTQSLYTASAMGLDVSKVDPAFDPKRVEDYNRQLLTAKERLELDKPKSPEAFTLSEGQTRFGPDGQPIANVPKPPSQLESGFTLTPGSKRYDAQGQEIASVPTTATTGGFSLAPGGARYDAEGNVIASRPETPGSGSRMWVYRDGQPVRVSEGEIQPGDTPASGREQGRPVTSGDANRMADYGSSLKDVTVLRGELFPVDPKTGRPVPGAASATGATAQVGAALPNFVTELTGWGTNAKQKQAVIDRVKQVIGKALEGGVLRKEDEYKYTKILPTIGNPPAVVKSKLDGLERAIQMKRDELLSSLDDAGYDTTAFAARLANPGQTTTPKKANPFRK